MRLSKEIIRYIDEHMEETFELLCELGRIPAPSCSEHRRAEFCRDWLERQGAEGVYIDEALNVVYPVGIDENGPVVVFCAHTDVVFPDMTELPVVIEDGQVKAPGIGDDTANLTALLMAAKYIAKEKLVPKNCGIALVCNSCEEGLGNLKGARAIADRFGGRLKAFYSFDGTSAAIIAGAVGSRRYRVEIKTEGGHSYGKFGASNAIERLAAVIERLYEVKVPTEGRTTYNVGVVEGGTSVNTIAQRASMLYEFRSNSLGDLKKMQSVFEDIIEEFRQKGTDIRAELLGERPCGAEVPKEKMDELIERAKHAIARGYDWEPALTFASTDCNIPLSRGIPAVSFGCYLGGKAHTREEFVYIDSLRPGAEIAFDVILSYF